MKSISPEELSGLLDGELDSARAAEIHEAIRQDARLQAEFARLLKLDAACLKAGQQASFQPKLSLSAIMVDGRSGDENQGWRAFCAVALLLIIHSMPKVLDIFSISLAINATILLVMLWALWRLCLQTERYVLVLSASKAP